jgi:hypothetical protein
MLHTVDRDVGTRLEDALRTDTILSADGTYWTLGSINDTQLVNNDEWVVSATAPRIAEGTYGIVLTGEDSAGHMHHFPGVVYVSNTTSGEPPNSTHSDTQMWAFQRSISRPIIYLHDLTVSDPLTLGSLNPQIRDNILENMQMGTAKTGLHYLMTAAQGYGEFDWFINERVKLTREIFHADTMDYIKTHMDAIPASTQRYPLHCQSEYAASEGSYSTSGHAYPLENRVRFAKRLYDKSYVKDDVFHNLDVGVDADTIEDTYDYVDGDATSHCGIPFYATLDILPVQFFPNRTLGIRPANPFTNYTTEGKRVGPNTPHGAWDYDLDGVETINQLIEIYASSAYGKSMHQFAADYQQCPVGESLFYSNRNYCQTDNDPVPQIHAFLMSHHQAAKLADRYTWRNDTAQYQTPGGWCAQAVDTLNYNRSICTGLESHHINTTHWSTTYAFETYGETWGSIRLPSLSAPANTEHWKPDTPLSTLQIIIDTSLYTPMTKLQLFSSTLPRINLATAALDLQPVSYHTQQMVLPQNLSTAKTHRDRSGVDYEPMYDASFTQGLPNENTDHTFGFWTGPLNTENYELRFMRYNVTLLDYKWHLNAYVVQHNRTSAAPAVEANCGGITGTTCVRAWRHKIQQRVEQRTNFTDFHLHIAYLHRMLIQPQSTMRSFYPLGDEFDEAPYGNVQTVYEFGGKGGSISRYMDTIDPALWQFDPASLAKWDEEHRTFAGSCWAQPVYTSDAAREVVPDPDIYRDLMQSVYVGDLGTLYNNYISTWETKRSQCEMVPHHTLRGHHFNTLRLPISSRFNHRLSGVVLLEEYARQNPTPPSYEYAMHYRISNRKPDGTWDIPYTTNTHVPTFSCTDSIYHEYACTESYNGNILMYEVSNEAHTVFPRHKYTTNTYMYFPYAESIVEGPGEEAQIIKADSTSAVEWGSQLQPIELGTTRRRRRRRRSVDTPAVWVATDTLQ